MLILRDGDGVECEFEGNEGGGGTEEGVEAVKCGDGGENEGDEEEDWGLGEGHYRGWWARRSGAVDVDGEETLLNLGRAGVPVCVER